MVLVEDKFLPIEELEGVYNTYNNNKTSLSNGWYKRAQTHPGVARMVNAALTIFNIQLFAGLEIWSHYNSRADWHFDKNEDLYDKTKEFEFPLCSIVFYPRVELVSGGELMLEGGVIIHPKTNRLVLMSPGIYHKVEHFVGERFSLLINIWGRNIYE